jgi:uncharacterized heparinase superfamily protein
LSSRYEQLESSNKFNGQLLDHEDALQLLKEQLKQQQDEITDSHDGYKRLLAQFHTKEAEAKANESPLKSEDDIKVFTQHVDSVFEQCIELSAFVFSIEW